MERENLGKTITLTANADLSSSQYCFMKVNSSGKILVPAAGGDAVGVLQDKPAAADRAGCVMVGTGVTRVLAGGSASVGGLVASDSSGRAVAAVSGDFILGTFLEAPTGSGQVVSILFQKRGRL